MPASNSVTPYAVSGEVDYEKLLAEFGADALTTDHLEHFPQPVHPLVRRGVFYAHRDVDRYLAAANAGQHHSIVTGIGPSGPMHLGHIQVFSLAQHLQDQTGATVYIPLSDDEKYFAKDQTLAQGRAYTRDNLKDLLAVGFDPENTRILVDTQDADVVYPAAAAFAKHLTPATISATYGDPPNIGLGFYPAVQAAHLVLPQLVHGAHPTLVPIAVDQDPHVRLCRDVADLQKFPVSKPGALLGKFLPSLAGPGKMSSSDDAPSIRLTDDRETVTEKLQQYAFSGGQSSLDAHREQGGNPEIDVAFQYLQAFFEPDDGELDRLAREYRSGELLSGELKQYAADKIANFLSAHQSRRPSDAELDERLAPFRLTADERRAALAALGL
ncbi:MULTISPECIES: tryptophan--tRNA ligase [unclassified Haladaptatus]|uniref:tryptophan--tRNA ligase n=1 Tax=unclassified Haladaptatus TaxID=2622732 RepID=UPI0023E787C9|nr:MULTISPECIES: tryptophan--tRNA ligase [unclassified Haladaptatus]